MARAATQSVTTVVDHIKELQKRLLVSSLALVAACVAVYFFYEPLLTLLRSPLGSPLYYTTPAGSFAFVMKICFMGALLITIPILIYNVIMFVRPAFEKALPLRRVHLTTLFSALLAIAGAAFGFLVIVPGALQFFAGFQVDGLSALISADAYLSFVTNVIITFIIVFQLPLLIAFIDTVKPLNPKKLLKGEKWVILTSLIISFLVPFALDITTSLLIAAPIVALYNLAILIVVMRHAQVRRRERLAQQSVTNVALIPSSSLTLSELSFEDLVGEPAIVPAASSHVARSRQHISGVMDIVPQTSRPIEVQPAAWVHRVHEQIALDPRARVISDIQPRQIRAT